MSSRFYVIKRRTIRSRVLHRGLNMGLYRISKDNQTQKLDPAPFTDELTDMEHFVQQHPEILGNMIMLDREVHRGGKGRMDLLALDLEEKARVMIIELKNVEADENVLLQVIGYAHEYKNRIDYVRAKIKEKFDIRAVEDTIPLDQIEYTPHILIIAPEFTPRILALAQYINLDIDFIRIARYREQEDFIVSIDVLETPVTSISETTGRDWSGWGDYQSRLGVEASIIEIGKSVQSQVEAIIKEHNWDVEPVFNKGYVSFKTGRSVFVEIDVYWTGGGCWLRFRSPQNPEELGIKNPCPDLKAKWDGYFKRWAVRIPSGDFNVSELMPYFKATAKHMNLGKDYIQSLMGKYKGQLSTTDEFSRRKASEKEKDM